MSPISAVPRNILFCYKKVKQIKCLKLRKWASTLGEKHSSLYATYGDLGKDFTFPAIQPCVRQRLTDTRALFSGIQRNSDTNFKRSAILPEDLCQQKGSTILSSALAWLHFHFIRDASVCLSLSILPVKMSSFLRWLSVLYWDCIGACYMQS